MLVLSRKSDQEIVIGDNIRITVLGVKGNAIKLGIDAPKDVRIIRGEILSNEKTQGRLTEMAKPEPSSVAARNTSNAAPPSCEPVQADWTEVRFGNGDQGKDNQASGDQGRVQFSARFDASTDSKEKRPNTPSVVSETKIPLESAESLQAEIAEILSSSWLSKMG